MEKSEFFSEFEENDLMNDFLEEENEAIDEAVRQFEEAKEAGETNIEKLAMIMSPVLQSLGMENSGSEKIYKKYISYLQTFNSEAAYIAQEAYDDETGKKLYAVIAAAMVCADAETMTLPIETIALANTMLSWKDKLVAIMYTTAPWGGRTLKDMVKDARKKAVAMRDNAKNAKIDDEADRFMNMIDVYPDPDAIPATDEDWSRSTEAVETLLRVKDMEMGERVSALEKDSIAYRVRLGELENNMADRVLGSEDVMREEYEMLVNKE